ncbi:MAG TPA: DUF2333 family protein [Candidatus Omnitrophota bacterium]|nr:DUF2333 family protein [Candidatus Omnitrophota bacterium]
MIERLDGWRQRLAGLSALAWWWWLAPAAALAILLYYPVGMALTHHVDDDPDFALAANAVSGTQSRAVAMASALVLREVEGNAWTANDPFFQPSWALDDMPNFQQGMVAAVARFAVQLNELSPAHDLDKAAGLLKYPGTVWMFDPSTSWAPTASSEKQYRNAARWLDNFNHRLGTGDAQLGRDALSLRAILVGVSADLGDASVLLERQIAEGGIVDFAADDVFHATKGRLYAYSLLLRELGWDYAPVLANGELGAQWRQMLETLRQAAALDPLMVVSGSPDGLAMPSHLASQGFYLLRARAQLDGIIAHTAP